MTQRREPLLLAMRRRVLQLQVGRSLALLLLSEISKGLTML